MPRTIIQETMELIQQSLLAFQEEVERIDPSERKELMDAETKCPELLDDAFKLQFLRKCYSKFVKKSFGCIVFDQT